MRPTRPPAPRRAGRPHAARLRVAALLLAFLFAAAPLAAASGSVKTPVAVVEVENQFDDRCSMPVAGLCLVDVRHADDPGNLSVDGYQRLEYVGVAPDFSLPRSVLGEAWVLPDDDIVIRGSQLYVRHGVFRAVTEAWPAVPQASEDYQVRFEPYGFGLFFYGPSPLDLTGPWGDRNMTAGYAEDAWITYEQVGPVNAPTGTNTDTFFLSDITIPCLFIDEQMPHCKPTIQEQGRRVVSAIPNATAGLEFYDVQVATDPQNLTPPDARAARLADAPALRAFANATGSEEPQEERRAAAPSAPATPDARAEPRPRAADAPDAPPRQPLRLQGQTPAPPPPDRTVTLLVGVAATGAILAALGVILYSRFNNRAEALESEMRNRLYALVRERPGICVTEAAAALGVKHNAILHHLRVLERVQLLRTAQDTGRKVVYPMGFQPVTGPAWLTRNETCVAILRLVQERPSGLPREDVHRLLPEVPERTRNYHMGRMLDAGALVQSVSPEGRRTLHVANAYRGGAGATGVAA